MLKWGAWEAGWWEGGAVGDRGAKATTNAGAKTLRRSAVGPRARRFHPPADHRNHTDRWG